MKSVFKVAVFAAVVFFISFACFHMLRLFAMNNTEFSIELKTSALSDVQISLGLGRSATFSAGISEGFQNLKMSVFFKEARSIRIDVGGSGEGSFEISGIQIENLYGKSFFSPTEIAEIFAFEGTSAPEVSDGRLAVEIYGGNARLYAQDLDIPLEIKPVFILAALAASALSVALVAALYRFTPIRWFIRELYANRALILSMAKNDFRTKYSGSYLGIVWAFIQPIVTVAVYTLVFTVGFRSGQIGGVPFVNWLTAGILPWYFFADSLINGSNSLIEYGYLVKKVVFNINILSLVKVISSLFVHLVFALIVLSLFLFTGYRPDIYWIQLIYYCACTFLFSLGLSYLCSAIILFLRDIGQIINVFLQIGVWLTPIMWQVDIVPERFLWIFKLNPMFYIVQGYRNSLIHKVWFWESFAWTTGFWAILVTVVFFGMLIFKRLKPHFADVI